MFDLRKGLGVTRTAPLLWIGHTAGDGGRRARTACGSGLQPGACGARSGSPHLEHRVARLGFDPQVSVVAADHHPVADVEAEARALTHRLGGEERLEDPFADLERDPRPGVADSTTAPSPIRPVRTVIVPASLIASRALSMMLVHTWLSSAG
jgi:hypothetical protein